MEKHTNESPAKRSLLPVQKAGFWLIFAAFILGFLDSLLSYLSNFHFDQYYDIIVQLDHPIFEMLVGYYLYRPLLLLGLTLYYGKPRENRLHILPLVLSIFYAGEILLYSTDAIEYTESFGTFMYYSELAFMLILTMVAWYLYSRNEKPRWSKYFLGYATATYIFLLLNARFINLVITDNPFNLLFYSSIFSMTAYMGIEVISLWKSVQIIENRQKKGDNNMGTYENRIANIIFRTGQVYIMLSIFGALIMLGIFEDFDPTTKWTVIVLSLVSTFVVCLIFFGAAEIIELLHKQNKKTEELIRLQRSAMALPMKKDSAPVEKLTFDDLPEL